MNLHLTLITGMSGSGKSVALRSLEDVGFYCVDNLPPALLGELVALQSGQSRRRLAVAVDVRSSKDLSGLPAQLSALRQAGVKVSSIFLDSDTDTLVRRFSETRRRHPLSGHDGDTRAALQDAIDQERKLLADLRGHAHVIDTSIIRPSQLQSYVLALIGSPAEGLTLVFESFGFKHGVPIDADYVFDVRMLPNPYYEPELRPLTGRDEPVARFLAASADVADMLNGVGDFLARWLGALVRDHRSYVTVAIGCTGGQHRSVYLAEQLANRFRSQHVVLVRHREVDAAAVRQA